MTKTTQQLGDLVYAPLERCSCSEIASGAIFVTKTCYYSDKNIFTALVHTGLDCVGRRLSPDISLVSRAPIPFVLTHLVHLPLSKSRLKIKTLACLEFAC